MNILSFFVRPVPIESPIHHVIELQEPTVTLDAYYIKEDWFVHESDKVTTMHTEYTVHIEHTEHTDESIETVNQHIVFDETKLIELDSDVLSEEELLQIKDKDVAMDVMRMIMEML